MRILRQNLFLVIVGGVLVVGSSILLAMKYQKADERDQMMLERQKVNDDIRRIPTGGFIKLSEKPGQLPAQITDLKARLEELKDEDEKLKEECGNWNSRTYKVLQLRNKVGGKELLVTAFPNVDQFKNVGSLCLLFKDTYREELGKLLASLSPVVPVTQEALDDEISLHMTRLQQDAARDAATRKKKLLTTRPVEKSTTGPGDGKTSAGPRAADSGGDDSGPRMDFASLAREKAVKTLMLRQATQGGKIYIASGAMDSFFGGSVEPSASAIELWQAQLNLWVQGDIVQAINDANDYATHLVGAKQASVLTSAVRKLVKITVDKEYCLGVNSSGASGSGGTASPGGGGASGNRLPGTAEPSPGAPGGTTEENLNLTQHCCNKDYDVIQYEFIVVMPARYIPALESCLMQRNFHTVLKVEIGPLSTGAQTAAGGGTIKTALIPPYYGADAVMEVTFKGELLLLTSWERGKYNSTDKKWESPQLMPKEVLDALPRPALRPEDVNRLSDATNTPAPK